MIGVQIKYFILVIFGLFHWIIFSQSISLNCNYPYYLMQQKEYSSDVSVKNKFNYDIQVDYNNFCKKSKFSIGIGLQSKNYIFNYSKSEEILKEKTQLAIISLPFGFERCILKKRNKSLSYFCGFSFSHIINFTRTIYKISGSVIQLKDPTSIVQVGKNINVGLSYNMISSNKFVISLLCKWNYKIVLDHHDIGPTPGIERLTNDRNSILIGLELQRLFPNKEIIFY